MRCHDEIGAFSTLGKIIIRCGYQPCRDTIVASVSFKGCVVAASSAQFQIIYTKKEINIEILFCSQSLLTASSNVNLGVSFYFFHSLISFFPYFSLCWYEFSSDKIQLRAFLSKWNIL